MQPKHPDTLDCAEKADIPMIRTREEALKRAQARYPLGSVWKHNTLVAVEVVGYDVSRSPEDSYCGVTYYATPRIHDGTREWSCCAPAHDLHDPAARV
jgi:hypothetical protein